MEVFTIISISLSMFCLGWVLSAASCSKIYYELQKINSTLHNQIRVAVIEEQETLVEKLKREKPADHTSN